MSAEQIEAILTSEKSLPKWLTLEFLSPFLWRAPPLKMRWECREFFPDHAGKGSLLSQFYFISYFEGSLMAQVVRNLPACRRPGFDPWVRKIPWKRNSYPLQYFCLENAMDKGPWQATVHGIPKCQTQLSNFILFLASF